MAKENCFVEGFGRLFWDHSSWETHMHSYTGPLLCSSLDAEGLLQWLLFDFLLSPLVPSSQSRGGHWKMGSKPDFILSQHICPLQVVLNIYWVVTSLWSLCLPLKQKQELHLMFVLRGFCLLVLDFQLDVQWCRSEINNTQACYGGCGK